MKRKAIQSLLFLCVVLMMLMVQTGCSIIGALYEEGQRRLEEQENGETTTATKADEEAASEEILAYLHEKYNEEFEIIALTFQLNTSDFIADVSLKSDPVVKFIAFRNMELDTIGDNYMAVFWKKDVREEFRGIMQELYPNNPRNEDFIAVINLDNDLSEEITAHAEEEGYPTYEELIEKYPDRFDMAVTIFVVEPISTVEDKQRQLEKVYEILQHYKNRGVKIDFFSARYFKDTDEESISHTLNIVGDKDINQISTVHDIEQFFHKVKRKGE